MKRVFFFAIATVLVLGSSGCLHHGCQPGGGHGAGGLGQFHGNGAGFVAQQPGPPTAAVGYPYYTTRGPRDFLVDNPPSIGY